jgi:hypothetical protein
MLPYLKLFTEARTDMKLRTLTAEQFRVWFHLLCYASEQDERGVIEKPLRILAIEVSGGDTAALQASLDALSDLEIVSVTPCNTPVTTCNTPGLLHAQNERFRVAFINFEKRQGRKPSWTPERTRERVAKSRANKRSNVGHQSPAKAVTPCNTPVTTCNTLDGDGELELGRLNTSPLGIPPGVILTGQRNGEDLADINAAIALLASDLATEHLGLELGRRHNTGAYRSLEGWRFRRAAKRIQDPSISASQRRSFPYFVGIAKGYSEAERIEKPPAKRESPAQRRQRELQEGFTAMAAREKAERERGEAS